MTRTALAAILALAPLSATAEPVRYDIDPSHTVVAFLVGHIGYARMLGQFVDVEGSFVYDAETQTLSDLSASVGIDSVNSFDDRRDPHIKSADFLDMETQPRITFTADGGTPASDTTGTVTGVLSMRGQEHPVTFEVTLNKIAAYPFGHGKETLGFSARATVLRSTWGSTYALQGDIVGDEVEIIIESEAIRAD